MARLKLDLKDRLILHNQFRILEMVDSDEAASYRRAQAILSQGYELEYDSLSGMLDPDTLSAEKCEEVYEILEMYRRLGHGYSQLSDKSGIEANDLRFFGFDGNNEGAYLSYGEFLNSERKYEESKVINSHMPSLAIYRRMLAEFRSVKDKAALDKADIQRVLAARIHPSRREGV